MDPEPGTLVGWNLCNCAVRHNRRIMMLHNLNLSETVNAGIISTGSLGVPSASTEEICFLALKKQDKHEVLVPKEFILPHLSTSAESTSSCPNTSPQNHSNGPPDNNALMGRIVEAIGYGHNKQKPSNWWSLDRFQAILAGFTEIGLENIMAIDDKLSEVQFRLSDREERLVMFKLHFDENFPKSAPGFSSESFPHGFQLTWNEKWTSSDVYSSVARYAESMQEFWWEMKNMDERTWVLHPHNPSLSDSSRRIAISNQ